MKKEQFEISIDHSIMKAAKLSFDQCLKLAISKAISTGADEGSAALKISFDIYQTMNEKTGEYERKPIFKFKTGYAVPTKETIDGKIAEQSQLVSGPDGYMIINGQISMDEILAEEEA